MHTTRQQLLARTGGLAFVEAPAAPEGGATESPEGSPAGEQHEDAAVDGAEGESPQEDDKEPFDSARALDKIRKLNSEAKNLRERAQEAERKAQGADELSKTAEAQASEILRLKVALKHGLPEALVGRLQGSTEEELLADAEDLMGLFVAKQPPSQSPKRKSAPRTAESAEDGVDIDAMVLSQLSQ